jgi:hypothetical protein
LQVFLERIVCSINQIATTLKDYTQNTLQLWQTVRKPIKQRVATKQHGVRSSSADSCMRKKTQTTPVTPMTRYQTVHEPVPLMENLENYSLFLEELRNEYALIVEQCAPKISKHFTKMTQVINEGNSYEFPSTDIHKAVILRFILNEPTFCHLI